MEARQVRARDVSLFVICVAIAAPLIMMTGIFGTGPAGGTGIESAFVVGVVVATLAAGGVSVMGWSFKTPAVLFAFGTIYVFSAALMTTMVAQLIRPAEVAAIFVGVFLTLFAVIGVWAALEIAGGAHGPFA